MPRKGKGKKKCNLLLCLLRISAQSVYTALCTLTVTKGNLSRKLNYPKQAKCR